MDPSRERGAGSASSLAEDPDSTSTSAAAGVGAGRRKLKARSDQDNLLSDAEGPELTGGVTRTVGAAGARRHRLTNHRQVRRTPQ